MMDWKQSLILSLCLGQIQAIEREMTFPIKAQSEECFYETALISQVIEIDYQIVDAGSEGRFAIDFSITKPDGQPHLVEYDKSENTHQVLLYNNNYKGYFFQALVPVLLRALLYGTW